MQRELVLLQAIAAEHAARNGLFCKCNRVLQRVLRQLDLADGSRELALLDETLHWDAALLGIYDELVALVRAGLLAEGQGNFGDDECAPAHPKFVECRLTEAGRQLVRRAFG